MDTLIAELAVVRAQPAEWPEGYSMRPCADVDALQLGRLYFEAYDPGEACETLEEAVVDIRATFAGDYGPFAPEASLAAFHAGEPVAAVLTVERTPWPDTPDCPFIVELFTHRKHRRRGLARSLLREAAERLAQSGETDVALRVAEANAAARALYASLGFRRWPDGQ